MADHNLLTLADVLRTIMDQRVSIHCLELALKQAIPQQSQIHTLPLDKTNTFQTRQMIQFEIKQHYKQCQDFSFITHIHQTFEDFNHFGVYRNL